MEDGHKVLTDEQNDTRRLVEELTAQLAALREDHNRTHTMLKAIYERGRGGA